jgi:hypothetical protein
MKGGFKDGKRNGSGKGIMKMVPYVIKENGKMVSHCINLITLIYKN